MHETGEQSKKKRLLLCIYLWYKIVKCVFALSFQSGEKVTITICRANCSKHNNGVKLISLRVLCLTTCWINLQIYRKKRNCYAIFNLNYLHEVIPGNNELCELKLELKCYIFRMNLFIEIPLLLQIRWPSWSFQRFYADLYVLLRNWQVWWRYCVVGKCKWADKKAGNESLKRKLCTMYIINDDKT